MKSIFAFAFVLPLAVATPSFAQEKSTKPERKTMIFQPGAKVPDGVAVAAPAEAPPAPGKPAETPPAAAPRSPAEIAQAFFTLLESGDIDAAYAGLTKDSKIAERPEELRALKTKTKEAIEVFGAIKGYNLVDGKSVGQRLIRNTYVSLGKEFPLRWRFYFYKAEDVWRLIDLRVDDKLTGIFDEPEEVKVADRP